MQLVTGYPFYKTTKLFKNNTHDKRFPILALVRIELHCIVGFN